MTKVEIMWAVFWCAVAVALAVDIYIMSKHKKALSLKEAGVMVACWVALALSFGAGVYFMLGGAHAVEYLTAYVVEYSLSIDNMFVFIMIFSYFAIPQEYQHKVLIWGVLGAILFRFIFIFLGVQLIERFDWLLYVFGVILIYTSIKMLAKKESEADMEKNFALKMLKKIMPLKADYRGHRFFIRENAKLFATPLFAAVVVIEMSDIIFAVDSIPAVLSITQNTLLVYSSNIFAILGLRSLYFLLAGMANKFAYLKYGIAGILFFIGGKMLLHGAVKIPTGLSLGVIVTVLAGAVIASMLKKQEA